MKLRNGFWLMISLFAVSVMSPCPSWASAVEGEDLTAHNRAVALMGQFDFESAYGAFTKLAETYPENNELQINRAIAMLNRQWSSDEAGALKILGRVLGKDPGNVRARYCAALLELHQGNLETALSFFRSVMEKDGEDPDLLYFIGKTLMQMGRYEDALAYFRRCIDRDQYVSSAYYGLIMTLRHLGRKTEAMNQINDYRRFKDNPRARIVEFKYTRMGKKAEVTCLDSQTEGSLAQPEGELFQKPVQLSVAGAEDGRDRNQWKAAFSSGSGITVCDMNQDGFSDLFIPIIDEGMNGRSSIILKGTSEAARFSVDNKHPLSSINHVNSVLWGDINDDGRVDAYLLRKGKNQLWLQQDDGGWKNISDSSGSVGKGLDSVDGALVDADHDGDLDIFVINKDGANELFNNNRDGTFRPLAQQYGLAGNGIPSRSVLIRDLDNDRDADVIVINQHPPHEVYINERLWNYRSASNFNDVVNSDIIAMAAGDLDADGKTELYSLDSSGSLFQWTSDVHDEWKKTELIPDGEMLPAGSGRGIAIALNDIDGDGRVDLTISYEDGWRTYSLTGRKLKEIYRAATSGKLVETRFLSTANGPAMLRLSRGQLPSLWLPGSGRYPFMTVTISGKTDPDASMRSNASGIGTRLSVRNGSSWTVLDTFRNRSGQGQDFQPLCIGTGGRSLIDFIRLDWSDGVIQTEIGLEASKRHHLVETQRQLSSCPVLFAWNGNRYEFVSDILGVGGIGYAIGPGLYAEPRPWEYFLFPEQALVPLNGKLVVKMTEPMEEVEYLDAVHMQVYDLPPGWSMTLDERMGISGPQPTGRPVYYRNEVKPVRVMNQNGTDVLAHVSEADLRAAPVGKVDRRFIGLLESENILSLEFEKPLDRYKGKPVLLGNGWVEYPYSQTSFAAWQAGVEYRAPSVDFRLPGGEWACLIDQAGYPAGMPRQMSIPLTGLPPGVRELRIRTNQEIYWDRLSVVYEEPCRDVRTTRLEPVRAFLEPVGFPRRQDFEQRRPYYDFDRRDLNWASRVLEGDYTRFGPVDALLEGLDNAVVIIGPGEGVHLEFPEPSKAVAKGWTRRFVLDSRGWCKDMDLYTNTGDTVGPVPASGLISQRAKELNQAYNIRYMTGRR